MYRFVVLFIFMIVLITGSVSAQTEVISPNVFLRGMQFSDSVRYTATLVKPSDNTPLQNVSVEITLPPDAIFWDMLVSKQVQFNVIRVNRENALTLIWQISNIPAENAVDAFAFTVSKPLSSEVEFYLEWKTADDFIIVENFFEVPPVTVATETEGAIFPVAGVGFQPIGNTGIQLATDSNQDALLGLSLLDTDFNPPPEYGDIWWCSLLELTGLAEGTTADVIVPLRRPVAPFTELFMFQQQADGSWLALDSKATVTADGAFAKYTHPGGLVATGGDKGILAEVVPVIEIPVIPAEEPVDPTLGDSKLEQELNQLEPLPAEGAPPPDQNSQPPSNEQNVIGVASDPVEEPVENPRDQNQSAAPSSQQGGGANPAQETERDQQQGGQAVAPVPDRPDNNAANAQPELPPEQEVEDKGLAQVEAQVEQALATPIPEEQITTFSLVVSDSGEVNTLQGEPATETTGDNNAGTQLTEDTGTDTTNTASEPTEQNATTGENTTTDANTPVTETTETNQTGAVNENPPAPAVVNEVVVVNPSPEELADLGDSFGSGGIRVEIQTATIQGGILQCQAGQINCAPINRRLGAGFR